VILEENPEKILQPPVWGIKGKHYIHIFYEGSLLFGPGNSDTLNTTDIRSYAHNMGLRYKLKLSRKICFIGDISYRLKTQFIKQKGNRFPDTLSYNKERLNFNQICLSPAFRFIYGSKKTYFGKHIDIGITTAFNMGTTRFTKQIIKSANPQYNEQIIKAREKHLNYILPFEADPFIAFGFEIIQFKIQYRLTDSFKNYNGKALAELPRLIFGINIALINN
jgi:hypothetical protein